MAQLAPIHPPLGINPSYCVSKQTTLQMKEKVFSLSGDSFYIKDENNQDVLQCQGQTFSISGRKQFSDTSGKPLFSLRTRLLSIHKSFYAEMPDGSIGFEVKGKFSSKLSIIPAPRTHKLLSSISWQIQNDRDVYQRLQ